MFQTGEHNCSEVNSYDVKSLYPYIMKICSFPDSLPTETKTYLPNHIGAYKCTIHHQNSYDNIIPLRSNDKPLDWKYKGEIENIWLNTVDIELIIETFGEDSITIHNGYYYETDTPLFRKYVETFEEEKTKQDLLKGKPGYSLGIRNLCKLLLNSLSGKVSQRFYDKTLKILKPTKKNLTSPK